MNTSILTDDSTARTNPECAAQRAENLAVIGVQSVLELCVGPSLCVLEAAYARHGITVVGNDIDERWARFHPAGNWIIGNALDVDPGAFDAVVFAPPVTRGCTGRRADSLRIPDVEPGYDRFMLAMNSYGYDGVRVMVLPARSIATAQDRAAMYELLGRIGTPYELVPLHAGTRRIRKYVDVYF